MSKDPEGRDSLVCEVAGALGVRRLLYEKAG